MASIKVIQGALELARRHELKSLAFPAISTGIYGYPEVEAATVAVTTVKSHSAALSQSVIFCCFDAETAGIHRRLVG